MARKRARVRQVVDADGGVPWLHPGECYDVEKIEGVDDTVRVRLYGPNDESIVIDSSLLVDDPDC